ncbi:MAG: sulfatase-like hydrolase/transferase [Planctomycetes bacterium]|nr:sulfatase-like hydrolase/transferase [Planctomycetota bacterium]
MNSWKTHLRFLAISCAILALMPSFGCRNKEGAGATAARSTLKNSPSFDHVVIISIDTLRADHLGCYGHPFVKSPNIDAFAKESLVFTQHISAAPTTLASHTSLMTGTYPHTHGVPKNGYVVGDENEMLAEILTKAGFESAGFIGAFPLDPKFNFDQGFAHFDARYTHAHKTGVLDQSQRRATEVTDSVLRWLDKRQGNRKQGSEADRLFLFVHYFDVHWPYEAPDAFRKLYGTASTRRRGSMRNIELARSLLRKGNEKEGLPLARALDAEYSAEITYCDEQIGRLFDELKARGIYEKAMIIVTSDHGETMHEHGTYFWHGRTVYDTEIHTPLIIRFPRGVVSSQRVERLVSNIDVAPTILHLLNLAEPARMEGESFAAIVDGELSRRGAVFSEATQPWSGDRSNDSPDWPSQNHFQCVRTKSWKYVSRIPDQQFGLYDLESDPFEQVNLLATTDANQSTRVATLKAQLEAWRQQAAPIASREDDSPVSKQRLGDLGYVEGYEVPADATTN